MRLGHTHTTLIGGLVVINDLHLVLSCLVYNITLFVSFFLFFFLSRRNVVKTECH